MPDMNSSATQPSLPAAMQAADGSPSNGLVRSRSLVLRVLNSIATQDLPLSVRFLNAGCTLASSLVFVDEDSNTLLLSCPPEWEMLLQAPGDSVMVGCLFGDSKIEFQAGACAKVDLDGTPVVGVPIPEFLWRFQRRRDPRQQVSGLKITLNMGFLEAEAEVVDLSVGGIGLLNCDRELKLAQGETLHNCAIKVPGVGRVPVNLVVQHRRDIYVADGVPATRVGCQFVGLADSARQLIAHYLQALANT